MESDGREALSRRVGRQGLSDKVASKQRPSVSQGGGRADACGTSIPGSATSKGRALKAEGDVPLRPVSLEQNGQGRRWRGCDWRVVRGHRTFRLWKGILDTTLGKVGSYGVSYSRRET